ncbi:hypothetical protein WA026_001894 [Henosepilachna vigintioctopunctata]|uniref:Ubiquitin-like protease family profile domain-containing protein n=1 Tax=Henosepilachna vigintioctopunctata TaxID=420089 RepID=A0AAW1UJH5_9CUCU
MGNSAKVCEEVIRKFRKFSLKYNSISKSRIEPDLVPFSTNHIHQKDSHKCGVFVIYFFDQYVRKKSLSEEKDMNEYRTQLKTTILEGSEVVTHLCLKYGLNIHDEGEGSRCNLCKQRIHYHCYPITDDYLICAKLY